MNCIDFRRQLDTDPAPGNPAFDAHRRECPECGAAAARSARFEALLDRAIDADPPENLEARILLRQSFAGTGRTGYRRTLAVAAGLVLAVGLAGGVFLGQGRPSLGNAVLAHLAEERFTLDIPGPVGAGVVEAALIPVGLAVKQHIADVRFATVCMVGRSTTAHLVLEGETAPITVLLMPNVPVAERVTIEDDRVQGMLLPAARGSIAVVGARGERLEEVALRIRNAVDWRA